MKVIYIYKKPNSVIVWETSMEKYDDFLQYEKKNSPRAIHHCVQKFQ